MKYSLCCEYCGKHIIKSRYVVLANNPLHIKENHYIIHKACVKGYAMFDVPIKVIDDFKNLCLVHVEWHDNISTN